MPEHALRQPDPPTLWCACTTPQPIHRAERKGAARTECARCGRPIKLRLA